jgi:hypothetical protein
LPGNAISCENPKTGNSGNGIARVTENSSRASSPRFYGRGKAIFLARIEEVAADLATGSMHYAYQTSWRDRLGVSYAQFTRYVKAHIRQAAHAPSAHALPMARPSRPAPAPCSSPRGGGLLVPADRSEPRQAPQEPARRFHFDPMDVDRKDLV